MHPYLQNTASLITGLLVGSFVNMGILMISGDIIPPPPGVDLTTEEGLKASMHLFGIENFIFPFLAHALGTSVGAAIAYWIAKTHKIIIALSIGFIFLLGGTYMVFILPSPLWFDIIDLVFAYIPMAYLGSKGVSLIKNQ